MSDEDEEVQDFLKSYADMDAKLGFVGRIIKAVGPHKVETRRTWANILFFRLYQIGESLRLICDPEIHNRRQGGHVPILDHASIAAVSRNLIEAYVMFSYISAPDISEEEWLLRRLMLDLDDVRTRYRVLKHIGDAGTDDARANKLKIDELKETIASNQTFQSLDAKRREELLKGGQMYVNGLRAAAREAGLDVEHHAAMQTVLSSHTHSTPVSFYRPGLGIHEVDPAVAPRLVFNVAGLALKYVEGLLGMACERMFLLYPEIFLKGQTKH